jgi:hypothetical protein
MTTRNDYSDFFDLEPRLLFNARLGQFGGTPNQRNFFKTQFDEIYDEFLGQRGIGILNAQQAGVPIDDATGFENYQHFQDFLSPNNFSFSDRFSSLPPALRPGADRRRFAPNVRFQF